MRSMYFERTDLREELVPAGGEGWRGFDARERSQDIDDSVDFTIVGRYRKNRIYEEITAAVDVFERKNGGCHGGAGDFGTAISVRRSRIGRESVLASRDQVKCERKCEGDCRSRWAARSSRGLELDSRRRILPWNSSIVWTAFQGRRHLVNNAWSGKKNLESLRSKTGNTTLT